MNKIILFAMVFLLFLVHPAAADTITSTTTQWDTSIATPDTVITSTSFYTYVYTNYSGIASTTSEYTSFSLATNYNNGGTSTDTYTNGTNTTILYTVYLTVITSPRIYTLLATYYTIYMPSTVTYTTVTTYATYEIINYRITTTVYSYITSTRIGDGPDTYPNAPPRTQTESTVKFFYATTRISGTITSSSITTVTKIAGSLTYYTVTGSVWLTERAENYSTTTRTATATATIYVPNISSEIETAGKYGTITNTTVIFESSYYVNGTSHGITASLSSMDGTTTTYFPVSTNRSDSYTMTSQVFTLTHTIGVYNGTLAATFVEHATVNYLTECAAPTTYTRENGNITATIIISDGATLAAIDNTTSNYSNGVLFTVKYATTTAGAIIINTSYTVSFTAQTQMKIVPYAPSPVSSIIGRIITTSKYFLWTLLSILIMYHSYKFATTGDKKHLKRIGYVVLAVIIVIIAL